MSGYVIRRRSSSGGTFGAILLVLVVGGVLLYGFLDPIRLSSMQEVVMWVTHGSIVETQEGEFLETCIEIPGQQQRWTVLRTHRRVVYRNGYSVETVVRKPQVPCP